MEVKQEVIDDFAKGTRTELDTTLRDVTKFVDEIDRKTTKIPVVKPLKYKELKTKDFKEFITDPTDKDKVDVHNLQKVMTLLNYLEKSISLHIWQ